MNKEKKDSHLFEQLKKLDTEQRNPATKNIDLATPLEIAQLINNEDKKVAYRVEEKLDIIARGIELVSKALSKGGRLIYAGAGTSGRLGILDAAECPPTFGTNPDRVIGLIAGGKKAIFNAQEGAEDKEENGIKAVRKANLSDHDVLCGIAASGRTPYVLGALKEAGKRGASTIFLCTVPASQIKVKADVVIDIPVGSEVIMGSTRMKSATAQKMVLNMLSTGAMIRQGKVLENVMVDLQTTNKKLEERSKRIVMMFTGVSYQKASQVLKASDGHVKTALVMILTKTDVDEARNLLEIHQGFIRKVLKAHRR